MSNEETFEVGQEDWTAHLDPDDATCDAESAAGNVCTRSPLHPTPHAAGDGDVIVEVWEVDPKEHGFWLRRAVDPRADQGGHVCSPPLTKANLPDGVPGDRWLCPCRSAYEIKVSRFGYVQWTLSNLSLEERRILDEEFGGGTDA